MDIARARQMGEAFLARLRITAAYKDVFAGKTGELVLHDIVRRCHLLSTPMVAGDAQMTAFNCGKQAAALEILEALRFDPERLIQLSEARDRAEAA